MGEKSNFFTSGHYFPPTSFVPSQFRQRLQDLETSDIITSVVSLSGKTGKLIEHKLHLSHVQYGQHVQLLSQHGGKVRRGGCALTFRTKKKKTFKKGLSQRCVGELRTKKLGFPLSFESIAIQSFLCQVWRWSEYSFTSIAYRRCFPVGESIAIQSFLCQVWRWSEYSFTAIAYRR